MTDDAAVDIGLWSRFTGRIMAVLLAAGFLVGVLLTVASLWKQREQARMSLLLRGNTLTRSLGRAAFLPLVLEDAAAQYKLVDGITEETDVVFAALYSPEGKVLVEKPAGGFPPLAANLPRTPGAVSENRFFPSRGPALWDFLLPLGYGTERGPDLSGYVRVGLSEELVQRQIRAAVRNNVALCVAATIAAFLTGAFLIQHMTRQMRNFLEQVQATAEIKRTNKELESFSYSVSHDLRAPLRSIDGFSSALLDDYSGRVDAKGQDYLRRIRAGCQRMGQLIDDLLALSRVIRQEMRWERVNLTALARTVADQLLQTEPERRVAFTAKEGATVMGDPGLLRIALENLLGNAWKFTQKKSDPRIEFGWTEEKGARAFYVRDNGAGFDMAYAGKLFGAFQRLHEASDFPGTGIGLATVDRIIRRHGGRIRAEGAVQQGALFTFTLPSAKETP